MEDDEINKKELTLSFPFICPIERHADGGNDETWILTIIIVMTGVVNRDLLLVFLVVRKRSSRVDLTGH